MKRAIAISLTLVLTLSMLAFSPLAFADDYVSSQTPLGNITDAKYNNISLAAQAIDDYYLPYGSTFSFNSVVGARTKARGYETAVNGRGAKVVGGGVAQVASTLYLALLDLDGITYNSLHTYGSKFNDNYVSSSKYAILVDYSADTDFSFTNYESDMTIEMVVSGNYVYCTLNLESSPSGGQTLLSRASFTVSGNSACKNNISLAADSINDTTLSYYDMFSFNDIVGPRSKSYGYESAINGRGAKVMGGGVAQVASVIWLAIKGVNDISVVEKSTYGKKYNQNYVKSSADAILTDYSSGTDFSFRYTGSGSITIYTYLNGNTLTCEIYNNSGSGGGSWW